MFTLNEAVFSLHDDIVADHDCRITMNSSLSFNALRTTGVGPNSYNISKEKDFDVIEPTPIGPKGIVVVSSFPLLQVSRLSALSPELLDVGGVQTPFGAEGTSSLQVTGLENKYELTSMVSTPSSPKSRLDPTSMGGILAAKWNIRFQELLAFRKEHGHCLVPMQNSESTELANWVKRQRSQYRRKMEGKPNTLCDQRQKALEAVGFVWDSRTTCWNGRYKELYQFWLEHGHTKVPKNYKKNPALAIWVKHQRRQYKKSLVETGNNRSSHRFSNERIRLLKELDFDFCPQR